MIAADFETGVRRLHDLVNDASVILPFTGAGISTECGIPDFRSPGGIWTRYQPIPFEQFMASAEMRRESWRRRFAMDAQFSTARPGRGHLALRFRSARPCRRPPCVAPSSSPPPATCS
jgi:NAD-dependent deacetylase